MSGAERTLPPEMMTGEIAEALASRPARRPARSPQEWAKQNLFNSVMNTIITIVVGPIALYLLYRFSRFVLVTGQWNAVRSNLELFMVSQYPRGERWRLVSQLILAAGAIGMAVGLNGRRARIVADQTGQPLPSRSWRMYLGSYWSIILFVGVLLGFSRTAGPFLLVGACLAAGVVGYALTRGLPAALIPYGWTVTGLVAVASFQILSGTGGWAWFFTTLALIPALSTLARSLPAAVRLPIAGAGIAVGVATLALRWGPVGWVAGLVAVYIVVTVLSGDRIDAARTSLFMVGGGAAYLVSDAIGHEGVDWTRWGGLHLTIVVAATATILALPLGILLALGRRSKLPAIKLMSVLYIEFFRGVPLISLLLASAFFFTFFLDPGSDTQLSTMTRATVAITLFSAAYVAEVVRGGLAAVSKGQVEAGQALGLSPAKLNRLIVLPQALRAVIPAMVGQFISLLKDTSLLGIIAINEFLGVRGLVHGQNEFRGVAIAEVLVFVAFGYWALTYTMSRESQRLERRLGIGDR
ncbi:MAG TPA: amino acid ABC transporter permease [Ilumatobacter sp.]|nr:amino acid ABC transporter permease [Ilumatobacter sp.]